MPVPSSTGWSFGWRGWLQSADKVHGRRCHLRPLPSGRLSLIEPLDVEQRQIKAARPLDGKVSQRLADHAGELEAMPGARRGNHDLWSAWKGIYDKVLVRSVREQASCKP